MGHMVQRWVETCLWVDLKYSGLNLLCFGIKTFNHLWILFF